jgi:hypothetical protein
MKSSIVVSFFALLLAGLPSLRATTYYVNSQTGNDSNCGISPVNPWKTLEKVNGAQFRAGDHILLHSGSSWHGQLVLHNSGTQGNPIVVDRYGTGPLPRIDGAGKVENTLQLLNVEEIEVLHLELTNHGEAPSARRAVLIALSNFGTAHHIVVADLYIHDVNGSNELKETGGILFRTTATSRPSRFDDLRIERNIVWKVDRSGIVGQSNEVFRTNWFPSLHVVVRDNYVDDVGGDGIVLWATDGALIEGNVALHCNQRAGSYNAGIWPWSSDNSLFELNEAGYTHSTRDGEGFDSDFNSRNTHFLYNYSHDNDGGFMMICTPVKRNREENAGNKGSVIEYNISHDDHSLIFNLSGADDTTVSHNAIYTSSRDDVQLLIVSDWEGWSRGAVFRSNLFDVAGTGRFGHALRRNPDGSYAIGPGWGGAEDIRFEGNKFFGHNVDIPSDPSAVINKHYQPPKLDWAEPLFDPAHSEEFPAYLKKHRQWMLRLFTAQFGKGPSLTRGRRLGAE